jgi:PAS domain S-box-containing protein
MEAQSLEYLFMQAPVAVCLVVGPDYKVELMNDKMLEFIGRTRNIIGQPLQSTLTEAKQQGLIAILDRVRETKESFYASDFPAVINIDGERRTRYFNLVFQPYYVKPDDAEPSGIFCVVHNITSQILALQKLDEEKQRTQLALEVGGLGMIITNWKENTATADNRASEIFQIENNSTLDEYLRRIHPEDRSVRSLGIEKGLKSGKFDFEIRLILNDGNIRWVRSRGVMQRNNDGEVTGSFGIVQDITEQKTFSLALHTTVDERTRELEVANQSLKALNESLQRSNRSLEEFARASSHDLKEPVRKVHFFVDRLKNSMADRLTNDEKMWMSRVESAAQRMGILIDDLLEYSHLDQVLPNKEPVDLNSKIAIILSDIELLIQEKDAVIEVADLPTVNGYRRQLQQLFQNLIGNALKYSREGVRPVIKITSEKIMGKDAGMDIPPAAFTQSFYKVEVCDNGIGFEQEDADRIFNVFTRLHGNKEYPGTGIGLSIVKKVVDNHGGYIAATGTPGAGACFMILFPAD